MPKTVGLPNGQCLPVLATMWALLTLDALISALDRIALIGKVVGRLTRNEMGVDCSGELAAGPREAHRLPTVRANHQSGA